MPSPLWTDSFLSSPPATIVWPSLVQSRAKSFFAFCDPVSSAAGRDIEKRAALGERRSKSLTRPSCEAVANRFAEVGWARTDEIGRACAELKAMAMLVVSDEEAR